MIAIAAEKLTKEFDSGFAVRDVTFRLPAGKIFGFVGPSGSGKTTTVRLLTGYYSPSAGQAQVLECAPGRFTQKIRRKIGYMPQQFSLFTDLTVWENLNFNASLYGMGLFRKKRLTALLDFVELRDQIHQLTKELSGGMQRRLALAATLVHRPDLIFLDEPTAGIDPLLRRKFWDYFRELHKDGRTLFITTQYVSEADYCDLVGVMDGGRLIVVETPDGLRRKAFGGDLVDFVADRSVPATGLPFVKAKWQDLDDGGMRLVVQDAEKDIPALQQWCKERSVPVRTIQPYVASLDDAFVQLVKEQRSDV